MDGLVVHGDVPPVPLGVPNIIQLFGGVVKGKILPLPPPHPAIQSIPSSL
jgi:hypothetical protein